MAWSESVTHVLRLFCYPCPPTEPRLPPTAYRLPPPSKVEPIDVLLREHEGLPEEDLISANFDVPEAPGLEASAAGCERARRQRVGGEHGEVPEISRVPEHDAIDDARFYVRLAHVRQRQADDLHVGAPGLAHGFRHPRNGW